MELIDLINELKDFRQKGFLDCNIEAILLKLKKIENGKKVKVPEFIADLIEEARIYEWDLDDLFEHISEYSGDSEISTWFYTLGNVDVLARAWLDGYEIEQEKRYTVRLKNIDDYLVKTNNDEYRFYNNIYTNRRKHTRKELERAKFGWVFDCEGVEIKEVEG